ncbi:hypothetical protein C2E21_0788 [Chlorella sorokiniana]|uniref:Uncharacterized protein n=1 Tax=Chlorella sorokiniana TaxID=3076 RepID=A0A2P6U2U3_CHLSO|nr:hypothetical protein C2E21_0788 [Chlorella sorokiniana]|eukprot:PRW60629.1 hypothetical protein C2E21_0788 [Chlorella sorokiniana]
MLRVVLPAFLGWLFTYYNTKKTDERKAQIERINDQVRQLYGPLLACVHASRSAYAAMVRQHSPDGTVQGFVKALQSHPEGPVGEAYRRWMKVVLQPLNEKAADIIVNHVDLLRTPYIDPLLLQLVAHVSANKVILRRWEEGNVREWSAISYPNQLLDYITSEFKRIKRKQAMLLGMGKRPDGALAAEDEKREANRLEPSTPRPPQAKL